MPLFVCANCGIVDNTALTNFWAVRYVKAKMLYEQELREHGKALESERLYKGLHIPALTPPEPPRYLCSACDPESPTHGHWHEWGYVDLKQRPFVG